MTEKAAAVAAVVFLQDNQLLRVLCFLDDPYPGNGIGGYTYAGYEGYIGV
jgi:hypothetical protein